MIANIENQIDMEKQLNECNKSIGLDIEEELYWKKKACNPNKFEKENELIARQLRIGAIDILNRRRAYLKSITP